MNCPYYRKETEEGYIGSSRRIWRDTNAIKWNQPKLWATILALLLCVVTVTACAVNPKAESTGSSEESEPESAAIQRMLSLQAEDILDFATRLSPADPSYNDTLAAAIRNAAGHGITESEEASGSIEWYCADLYLSVSHNGGFGTFSETIHFEESLTEPVIHALYVNPKTGISERVRLEDETLYWLIRNRYTLPERVETSALAPHWNNIHQRAADTVERINGLNGYDLISFYPIESLSDGMFKYDVYYWSAAYKTDDPDSVSFAGAAGLDSQGRVIGLNEEECYFIVRDDGAVAFVGFETPFGYDDESIHAHNIEQIQRAFAQGPGA